MKHEVHWIVWSRFSYICPSNDISWKSEWMVRKKIRIIGIKVQNPCSLLLSTYVVNVSNVEKKHKVDIVLQAENIRL